MIDRYTNPEMKKIWDQESKFQRWLQVEKAICEGLAREGVIPKEAARYINSNASIDPQRVKQLEKETRHDVAAFIKAVGETIPGYERFFHMGVTSSDVVDTSLSLAMKDSFEIILKDVNRLSKVLENLAKEYRNTPVMGRTHGVHAEPTIFGLKFLSWLSQLQRGMEKLLDAQKNVSVGCISGAVGIYSTISPEVEQYVCKKLGLKPAKISTQIIQRDRHVDALFSLTIVSSVCERIALEIRHLQRTEVLEAEESFFMGQKGSSAMPHKKNPVNFEQVCGLCRVLRGNLFASLENVALWHERDISHSSVERIIIPDSFILCDYILSKTAMLLENLRVYPDRMKKNIEITRRLYFSQKLMLALCDAGLSREKAYRLVQKNAMETWEDPSGDFLEVVSRDPKITELIPIHRLKEIFDFDSFFIHVDRIYGRFGL